MRIAIIGAPGSGKSTLGYNLSKLLKIPLYHLDQYFWKPNWQEPDRLEFEKIHTELCDKDQWIIDGMAVRFFEYRLERADTIIFLDMPTYLCLYRVFKRAFMHFGKVNFSSAPGCIERFPSFKFLKYIWTFQRDKKPQIQYFIDQHEKNKKVFYIKTEQDLIELISRFESRLK